jgi:hypothetical protein
MQGIRRLLMISAASLALLAVPSTAAAATVANGDFETGTLSGWQTQLSGAGNWFAYSGTSSPVSAATIAAPPQGSFAAVTDQDNPGSTILYQDVALAPDLAQKLSLYVYYHSFAAIAHPSTDSLSESDLPNQQYRIDVMKPSASPTSIDPADILLTVFRTATGDPPFLAPTKMTADLSSFAGQTVRLRFAEVDNQSNFNASTDAVSITPSNSFAFGAVQRNKKKGTATLNLTVPNPGDLTGSGNGAKVASANGAAISKAVGAGHAQLVIKAKGKKKRKLNQAGKVKLNVTVTYTPTGGSPSTQSLTVKLKKI